MYKPGHGEQAELVAAAQIREDVLQKVAVADGHQGRQIRSQRHGNMDQQTRSDANAGRAQIEKLECGLSARKYREGHAEARLLLQRGPASAAQRADK